MLRRLLTAVALVLLSAQLAQADELTTKATTKPAARATSKKSIKAKPESLASWQARHSLFYRRNWGVEIVGVRRISSGLMLRFDYRVIDPKRAVSLNDKHARPYLVDDTTHTALAVPAMENVGELRQVAPYDANRTYFILFGNPGGLVKHGARVTLVMGNLRAEGLVVE